MQEENNPNTSQLDVHDTNQVQIQDYRKPQDRIRQYRQKTLSRPRRSRSAPGYNTEERQYQHHGQYQQLGRQDTLNNKEFETIMAECVTDGFIRNISQQFPEHPYFVKWACNTLCELRVKHAKTMQQGTLIRVITHSYLQILMNKDGKYKDSHIADFFMFVQTLKYCEYLIGKVEALDKHVDYLKQQLNEQIRKYEDYKVRHVQNDYALNSNRSNHGKTGQWRSIAQDISIMNHNTPNNGKSSDQAMGSSSNAPNVFQSLYKKAKTQINNLDSPYHQIKAKDLKKLKQSIQKTNDISFIGGDIQNGIHHLYPLHSPDKTSMSPFRHPNIAKTSDLRELRRSRDSRSQQRSNNHKSYNIRPYYSGGKHERQTGNQKLSKDDNQEFKEKPMIDLRGQHSTTDNGQV